MAKKTIIANYGGHDLGKTESVKLVYEKLEKNVEARYKTILHTPMSPQGDLCAILIINGVKVGFSSLGDWCPEHSKWLDELAVTHNCDIIVAACQWKGKTTNKILSFAPTYRIWWSSNARLSEHLTQIAPKTIQKRFNEQWAEEIANMVDSWCYA